MIPEPMRRGEIIACNIYAETATKDDPTQAVVQQIQAIHPELRKHVATALYWMFRLNYNGYKPNHTCFYTLLLAISEFFTEEPCLTSQPS